MTQTVNDRTVTVVATSDNQSVFAYDFQTFDATHVAAIFEDVSTGDRQDLVSSTDFSVQNVGNPNGGTITLLTLGASVSMGDRVTIFGSVPINRTADYQQSGDFLAATVNREEDTQIQVMQELRRDIDRSFKAQFGNTVGEISPGAEGQVLVYDDEQNLIPGPQAGDIEGAQANAEAAQQSATEAAELAASISPYANRAAAIAATVPASSTTIRVRTDHGKIVDYAETVFDDQLVALVSNDGGRYWKPANVITPHHYGQVGSDTTVNTAAMQAALDALSNPLAVVTTDGVLDDFPPMVLDLLGDDIVCDAPLQFVNQYYVKLQNGQLMADSTATWAPGSFLCNVQWTSAIDVFRQQRIRNLHFDNLKINGGAVTSCVYAENTFDFTISDTFLTNWVTNGFGLDTADRSTTPIKKNTHMKLLGVTAAQKELSVPAVGDGTALRIRTSDYFMANCVVFKAAIGLDLQGHFNGQITNFHSFVDAANICWRVGPECHNTVFTNCYSDTGRVVQQSFSTTYNGGIFVASSTLQLDAVDTTNENGSGLLFNGVIMGNVPTFIASGTGSWSADRRIVFSGCRRENGQPLFGHAIESGLNNDMTFVSGNTQRFQLNGSGHLVPATGMDAMLDVGATGNILRRMYARTLFVGGEEGLISGGSSATPNGNVTANPGGMYLSSSGGTGATLWVKETGTGNTGWVAK